MRINPAVWPVCHSLIETGRLIAPEMYTVASPYLHQELSDEFVDLKNDHLNIIVPRGHAKSSLYAFVGVMWHWLFQEAYRQKIGEIEHAVHKKRVILLVSKTQGEAKKRLNTIKTCLDSPHFKRLFGDFSKKTSKGWTTDRIELKDGTVIVSKGMGQQVRGLKEGHLRPTLVIVDDPEDAKNTITEDAMRANMNFIMEEADPGLDAKIGRLIVIGTPINMGCIVVRLHELGTPESSWKSLWFQNDAELNQSMQLVWSADGTAGEVIYEGVLWPELYHREKLLKKKADAQTLGLVSGYYREYEAKSVGDEDQAFKPEYFRWWIGSLKFDDRERPYINVTHIGKRLPLKALDKPLEIPVETFVGIDPASSLSRNADFTVVISIAIDKQGRIFILPYTRGRYLTNELITRVVNNHKGVRPSRGMLETTGAQVHLEAMLREKGIRYVSDKPFQKKVGEGSRIGGIQPLFADGKVFMQPEMVQLKSELLQYPRSRKDDTGDALEKAIRVAGTRRARHKVDHSGKRKGVKRIFREYDWKVL